MFKKMQVDLLEVGFLYLRKLHCSYFLKIIGRLLGESFYLQWPLHLVSNWIIVKKIVINFKHVRVIKYKRSLKP